MHFVVVYMQQNVLRFFNKQKEQHRIHFDMQLRYCVNVLCCIHIQSQTHYALMVAVNLQTLTLGTVKHGILNVFKWPILR